MDQTALLNSWPNLYDTRLKDTFPFMKMYDIMYF